MSTVRHAAALAFFGVLSAWHGPIAAQESLLEPGDRIRVEARGEGRLVGTLVERADTGLVVARDSRPRFLADSTITSLEVSLGYHSEVGSDARAGAIGGAGLGLLTGILYVQEGGFDLSAEDDAGIADVLLLTVVGSAVGATGGALLGLLRSGEDWVPVDPRGRVVVDLSAVDRSVGVGVRLALAP